MSAEVAGVSLRSLEEPIREALLVYEERSEGRLTFDTEAAHRLELTPDKPNSARSVSTIAYMGEATARLYVIVFAPLDGTGDESAYRLSDIDMGNDYTAATKIVPRSKAGISREAHLTLASYNADEPQRDPILFAGSLTLWGLKERKLVRIGELGQPLEFEKSMLSKYPPERPPQPTVTLTTGYHSSSNNPDKTEKFGDPHAVYNPWRKIAQVCGFIAIPSDALLERPDLLDALDPREPVWEE